MKTQLKAASLIAAIIFSASSTKAQTPIQPPTAPAAPGIAMASPPPLPPDNNALKEVTACKGKVVKLVSNDDYVYDGFYILNGSDSLLVKFPPHLGTQITKIASVGSSITVNGVAGISPIGQKEMRMVNITANGNTNTDALPAANTTPVAETSVSGSGKVSSLQTNPKGQLSGLLLDNNTILRIPPMVRNQVAGLIQQGASISYTGSKRALNNGEAMAADYTVIHCTTLTVNGKQYLVK